MSLLSRTPRSLTQNIATSAVLSAMVVIGGCNGTDETSVTAGPNGYAATQGESCAGDPNRICIGVRYVAYKNSAGVPVTTSADARANIERTNDIWKQCNIAFQIEKYEEVNPVEHGLAYGGPAAESQTEQVRKTFGDTTRFLIVTAGNWNVQKNGWTNPPGLSNYGAIMDGGVGRGYAEIYAHELGHYLNLDHVNNQSNLMNATIYKSPTQLTDSQCEQARASARAHWPQMVRS